MAEPATFPTRIAFVLPDMTGGGAERVAISAIQAFLERGCEVDLVVMRAKGALLDLVPPETRIFDLGAERLRHAVWPLVRYLRERRPMSIQVSMWPLTVAAILAVRLSRVAVRVIVSDHSILSEQYKGSAITTSLLKATTRLFYPMVDARIAVSDGCADDLARLSHIRRDRFEVVYNPVPAPSQPIETSPVVEQLWGGPEPRILTVGNLKRVKNHVLLLEAFADLLETRPARLMILGEGELRGELEERATALGIAHSVIMPGFAIDPWPFYASANLFVLSSDYEGFGNAIVEAMHAGLPIVSTDCPSGPAEILDKGRFGRLVPVGDAGAVADAMGAALDEPVDSDRLKARARSLGGQESIERYVDLMLGPRKTAPANG